MTAFIIVLIGAFYNLLSENSGRTFKDLREDIKMPSMTICPLPVYRLDSKNLTIDSFLAGLGRNRVYSGFCSAQTAYESV